MKKGICLFVFLLLCLFTLTFTSCQKRVPSLSTTPVSEIGPKSATAGGIITSDGNDPIIFRGVCWSTKKDPSTTDAHTTDGYGTGAFTSVMTNLIPNTFYYVKAYASNDIGTSFGNEVTFTTAGLSVPELTTVTVTGITQTTAVSGGNITFDGGTDVTLRGICWSTHTQPTIADSKSSNGEGTGSYSSNITGLTGNIKYYVRAYAVNSEGTGYGQEVSFTSGPVMPAVTTTNPLPTGSTTAISGGNITNDGGSAVTSRGVCWSTSLNPTITNSKTADGTGTGTFSSNIAGLAANTRYHVRAYATNTVGTAYGTDKTFNTDPVSIQDFDNNDYNVIRIGTQVWIQENLKTTHFNDGTPVPEVTGGAAWSALTTPGYCWYNNGPANKDPYGALYNWYAVNAGKLCPTGWHIPSDDECTTLEYFLGGPSPAGGKLKEAGTAHWDNPNVGATNESTFTALPGGWRSSSGVFEFIGTSGYWWTSPQPEPPNTYNRRIQNDQDKVFRNLENEKSGMSVRCIKD